MSGGENRFHEQLKTGREEDNKSVKHGKFSSHIPNIKNMFYFSPKKTCLQQIAHDPEPRHMAGTQNHGSL